MVSSDAARFIIRLCSPWHVSTRHFHCAIEGDNSKGAVRDVNAVLTFCMETRANSRANWDGDADSWKNGRC